MIGIDFHIGWLLVQVILTDLLDKRYNKQRTLKFLPTLDLCWFPVGESHIVSLIISWLNLELSFIFCDFDYYCDSLEELINEAEQMEEGSNDKQEEETR